MTRAVRRVVAVATLSAAFFFACPRAESASLGLGHVLFNAGFTEEEKMQYEKHLAAIKDGYRTHRPEFQESAHYYAYWYNTLELKNHEYALEILRKAADIWPDEDEIWWMMARTYGIHLGNVEKAAECRKKAEELFAKKAETYRKAFRYHFELAQRYLVVDEPSQALDECWKSIESGEEQKRCVVLRPGYHWSCNLNADSACWLGGNIARQLLGQPRAAVEILSRAFEVWPDSSEIHYSIAWSYGAWLMDFPDAQKHMEKALAISYSMPDSFCQYEGVPPNRKKVWHKAYENKKGPEWERVREFSFQLAHFYLDEVDQQAPDKADENASKALGAIMKALDTFDRDKPAEGWRDYHKRRLYQLLAQIYGNYPLFRGHDGAKALKYALEGEEAGKRAEAYLSKEGRSWHASSEFVGFSYYNAGNYEEAIKYLSPATYLESRSYLSLAREKLADRILKQGDDVESLAKANKALESSLAAFGMAFSWIQGQRNWTRTDEGRTLACGLKWRNIMTHGIKLNLRLQHPDAALGLIENGKARALLDLLSMCNTASTEHLLTRSEREKQLLLAQADEIRGKIEAEKNVPGGTDTVSLQRSLSLVEDKAKKLAENVGNWRNEIECTRSIGALNLNDVKKLMEQSGATLVSYWDTNYVAVVSSNVFEIRPLNCPDLPRQIAAFRDAIAAQSAAGRGLMPEADKTQKPKADAVAPVSRELYDALIRPVEDLIRTDLVFISPDSSTHFLAFQALNDGTNYFGEKHAITYAPSASVLKYCIAKRKPATGKILALGNPNLRQAEYKLVNAEKEAAELAGAFPDSKSLVGNEATEKAVQLLGPDYDVIHFACHGTVDLDEPMQSCLRLSPDKDNDGYLHAGEIFDMHLNASLVTLSACESGLGKVTQGSEVLGLPRAFMFAGTPSVVASLWKVDDKATAELMKAFYGNLKTMDKAEALRQAQVSMIRQGKSPFYWAAFCLYGDYK